MALCRAAMASLGGAAMALDVLKRPPKMLPEDFCLDCLMEDEEAIIIALSD